ncbi:DMT family transporter [Dongia deserti]|uniref:DMT family transporter n=1 Tax=Dongia deserti TaxID=2268030 RepID=UPI000E6490D1|nr:DMT family transporter [Dongia deserti]
MQRMTGISSKPMLVGSLAALSSVLIWSGWIVFTRHGVTTDVPPVTLGLLRYSIPTVIMLPLLLRSGGAYRRAGWAKCAIMICGSGAPFFLICSLGMTFAPAAHVGIMLPGVMPMFVALFSVLLFGERFGGARLVGYGLVLAGVLALGGAGLLEAGAGDWRGHALLLLSAASWACFTLAFKRSGLTAWQAAVLINAVSVVVMIAVDAIQGGPRLWDIPWQTVATQGFAQGILSGLLALAAYGYAVSVLGASKASAFVSLTPALTAVIAALTLAEWPDGVTIAAVLMVGAGVALASGAASGISFKRKALPQQG